MDSSTRVPAAEITGVYGALVRTMSRRMLGQVPDSLGVMWHHPAVLRDFMGLARKAERWDRLDDGLGTYAIMAAAATIGCGFCLDFNYFLAHGKGLDEAKVREVPRWRESAVFTPTERRAMEYAERASQTPPTVTDELVAALLGELGAPGVLELTARVALMNMTARSNIALGIRSQEFAASCGLPPLATPSTGVASRP
ncbi:carboxymuconolactone decarboxylase family protein [Cellulosimicrobium sp. CUA-896]|uniref:carboxymuconolactone decarboxylase family protein n=1 Tax=Cellulosimicrobium sp. CUA-896 TaxID=1517881 RepID=UPI000969F0B8|nr:carboxymuconolactone decarboxylase family protein [Cellulosimicrobium sp. CUA-896]OLT55128.1 carboxymuconolactone decarboxylase [Cellulosimicrobium sp. CUA-896]